MVYFLFFVLASLIISGFPLFGGAVLLFVTSFEGLYSNQTTHYGAYFALAFVFGFLVRFQMHPYESYKSPYLTPFILLGLGMGISCLFSLNPIDSFLAYLNCLVYVIAGYLIILTMRQKWAKSMYFFTFGLILFFQTGIAYGQLLNIVETSENILSGGTTMPALFSIQLALFLPFWLLKFHECRSSSNKVFVFLIFLLILVVGIAAKSRMGTGLLLLSSLGCLIWGLFPVNRGKACFGILGIAFVVLLFQAFFSDDSISDQLKHWFANPRLQQWIQNYFVSFRVFNEHPFTGVGFGQIEAYIDWRALHLFAWPYYESVLSTFSTLLSETGLFGILPFYALAALFWKHFLDEFHNSITNGQKAMFIMALLWLIATFLYPLHEHLFAWCVLGVILGSYGMQNENSDEVWNRSEVTYKLESSSNDDTSNQTFP